MKVIIRKALDIALDEYVRGMYNCNTPQDNIDRNKAIVSDFIYTKQEHICNDIIAGLIDS